MKKIFLLIIIIFTTNAFSQIPDNKSLISDMNNFYNKGKIEKLELLTSEILSGKYGSMDDELKFYALSYSANVFTSDTYTKKDPQKGYDKAIELIEFVKLTNYNVPNKDAYLKSMIDFMPEYIKKYPNIETVITNKNNSNTQDTISASSDTEDKTSMSDNKTVTLTVSGSGKTLEEARLNALRSAIEQAFGAFISSKTEILNDNLVKDEIVSVTNGNIQKYDVVSQVEVPNVGFVMTLNATVSIEKLTSFAESKGVVVEFKGGMFGLKMKLQKLNEQAEIITIKNLTSTCFDILSNAVEFDLNVSEPRVATNDNTTYLVDFTINTKRNDNYESFINYFKQSISKLSLSSQEKEEYLKLNKQVYKLEVDSNVNYLRTLESIKYLCAFFATSPIFNYTFKIYSNVGIIKFNFFEILGKYRELSGIPLFDAFTILWFDGPDKRFYIDKYFNNYIRLSLISNKNNLLYSVINNNLLFNENSDKYEDRMQYNKPHGFDSKFINNTIQFTKAFKLSDIEKINEFKIEKISINDFLQNRKMYMEDEPK